MLTFPMNVISWNINGLNNATRALNELNSLEIQFHPEKSQDNGLRLLQNWVEKEY